MESPRSLCVAVVPNHLSMRTASTIQIFPITSQCMVVPALKSFSWHSWRSPINILSSCIRNYRRTAFASYSTNIPRLIRQLVIEYFELVLSPCRLQYQSDVSTLIKIFSYKLFNNILLIFIFRFTCIINWGDTWQHPRKSCCGIIMFRTTSPLSHNIICKENISLWMTKDSKWWSIVSPHADGNES